jgi:arylformamidase
MPYLLSPPIHKDLAGLWGEGPPYSTHVIYNIHERSESSPPVHYEAHLLKPHSIPHIDAPAHIIPGGKTVDCLISESPQLFFGSVTVLRLEQPSWQAFQDNPELFLWEVSTHELQAALQRVTGSTAIPDKIFITPNTVPLNVDGFHDPRYIFVLSPEAAAFLTTSKTFHAFGTSWKSSDFQPHSLERPVHSILLKQAVLFEQLALAHVPEGNYFLSAMPLYLHGASESPVSPLLFTKQELTIA